MKARLFVSTIFAALILSGCTIYLRPGVSGRIIQVNTLSPGDFPTDLNTTARDYTDEMKTVIPAKRIGEVDNIAGAAIFLASQAGNFNVGSNIVVDGGESVRGIQRAFYARVLPDFVRLDR